ncbi:uncharacterized protein EURHEDRAFT_409681 [Aspergillus ruber CBS 135680]|uniref:Integral membrane protein n=1 Tax=Aspergillus ruber (strain CBS 135680) TaxID=1388766 RepID=A0A017SLE2_ASPRC|nr:uncharacterized protein EURHEDRAFT_409681 [Aspergillus ruber CBS 135680]EYE97459.1 hypothetical protein EURHEDRAFT_409681 [Aspergillus ruber CBS 135680]
MDPDASILEPAPSIFNYVLSFLLVGVAWGFTTPFIRRAAADFNARQEAQRGTKPEPQEKEAPLKSCEEKKDKKDDNEIQHEEDTTDEDEDETEESEEKDKLPTPATKQPAWMNPTTSKPSWLKQKLTTLLWTVFNLLRTPAYSIPLVVNLTGSVWFFLLVGKHELSLTVPLANSSAFLFTVLGEWYVERKMIAKETWLGMGLVLGGFALCVQSKQ